MNNTKRAVSLALALILLFTTCIGASAVSVDTGSYACSEVAWDYYCDGDIGKVMITPGADETQINLCWHSPNKASVSPIVRVSEDRRMRDYRSFAGVASESDVEGWAVNRVTVTGLKPETTYYYDYKTDGGYGEVFEYTTGSVKGFSFVYISDMQPDEDANAPEETRIFNNTLAHAIGNHPELDFIVSGGDQTQHGDSSYEWSCIMASPILRSYAWATVVGNHDNKGESYKYYVNNPNTWNGLSTSGAGNNYWFRYGDTLFLMINSTNGNFPDQYNFMKLACNQNKDAKWKIAVFHHDIYGTGRHTLETDNHLLCSILAPLMDEFGVDLALTGHEHIYGRSYIMKDNRVVKTKGYADGEVRDPAGTLYVTANSCAGKNGLSDSASAADLPWCAERIFTEDPLYTVTEIDGYRLKLSTYSAVSGDLVDEFTITKTGIDEKVGSFLSYFLAALTVLLKNFKIVAGLLRQFRGI